jgi:hypothetical protein
MARQGDNDDSKSAKSVIDGINFELTVLISSFNNNNKHAYAGTTG